MFVVVERDTLELVEIAQVECHDAIVLHRSILDGDAVNIFSYLLHDSYSVFMLLALRS